MGFGNRNDRRRRLKRFALDLHRRIEPKLRASANCSVLMLGLLTTPVLAGDGCAPERLDLRGPWGTARFTIELADDDAERMRGLMFRERLATSHGMLFLYPEPGRPAFWMKNTLIPLDMLFITPEGRVQHVHENAIPGDLRAINGGPGVLAVLEIQGGLARRIGIAAGSELRHPGFEQAIAAWPCSTDE